MWSIDSVAAALPPLRLVGTCVSVLVIYVCVKRRPQEIGGWLLYYYIQLYIGESKNFKVFPQRAEIPIRPVD